MHGYFGTVRAAEVEMLPDQQARELAVVPSCSCVVQAPAGSGKTSLLVERVLQLLAVVDNPDTILVLTFTNKATANMLERIAKRLRFDDSELVRSIHRRDQLLGWGLMDDLARLRVQTIDGFCSYLVQKLLPDRPFDRVVQGIEAELCYRQAVERWLTDCQQQPTVQILLDQLGFHHHQLINFLVRMLARRDRWLSHLLVLDTECLRHQMEHELQIINRELMDDCCFPPELFKKWQHLYRVTADFYSRDDLTAHQWQLLQQLWSVDEWRQLDEESAKELAGWLLTKNGQWRQRWTSEQAIVSLSLTGTSAKLWRELKTQWHDWQQQLLQQNELLTQLRELSAAPVAAYSKEQWQAVSAILSNLSTLVAYLQLVWQEKQLVDYTEITVLAIRALDPISDESGQTLRQLFRWQHLLVDEFQDTSLLHFRLLGQLTEGWSSDSCSIFLVGDPMQSIYRFRQAEVGIFLWVQRHGISNIALTNLTLNSNFRAAKSLMDWVNQHFVRIFPRSSDVALGAIGYTPSVAQHDNPDSVVNITSVRDQDAVFRTIVDLQTKFPGQEIAVLAQTRRQLLPIAFALRKVGIAYQALELEELLSDATARKLWALMRLVLAPEQRWSWYNWWLVAYETTPPANWDQGWGGSDYRQFISAVARGELLGPLSPEQIQRWLLGVEIVLENAKLAMVSKRQLWTNLIKSCRIMPDGWNRQQLAILQRFDELWLLADVLDVEILEAKLQESYLPATLEQNTKLQLMTMHKAKGLEFDHVIIPELNGAVRSDERAILVWQERLHKQGGSSLLLASGLGDEDKLYSYIVRSERLKVHYELIRLFYVAVTRAKTSLSMLVSSSERPLVGSLWELYMGALSQSHDSSYQEVTDGP